MCINNPFHVCYAAESFLPPRAAKIRLPTLGQTRGLAAELGKELLDNCNIRLLQFRRTPYEYLVSIGQVKRAISELVNCVTYAGERIILTSRDKPKANEHPETCLSDTLYCAEKIHRLHHRKKWSSVILDVPCDQAIHLALNR